MNLKRCARCGNHLPQFNFGRLARASDGLNFSCKSCVNKYNRAKKEQHRDAYAASERARELRRARTRSEHKKRKYQENRAESLATCKAYRVANPEKVRERHRLYRKRNPGLRREMTRRYEAQKLLASPAWRNQFFIREIYELAVFRTRMTGIRWHVDHVIPLKSKIVCGLHVEHNLRIVPAAVNLSKGNKLPGNI